MKDLHLVCNAHIDPVWQWDWEEGAAAAVSTFRVAAELAEQFDGFVFNHNEALLYRWIEEYEPVLFQRIQRLVQAGKWHIMGGWYLQPDCNMPSGESFVRQITLGRRYFQEKFAVTPRTAVNFDPFGHSRGLVQILAKSGYDSCIFCRPDAAQCSLPAEDFWWVGFDGSRVLGHRSLEFYNSGLGKAREKVTTWLEAHEQETTGLLLWGVGNHGGGPSRQDLLALAALISERHDVRISHSTPESYFTQLDTQGLPSHASDLNPSMVGCYTSQVRIKQLHRKLENQFFLTEKIAAGAAFCQAMSYPASEMEEAARTLALSQFHDILPGSSVQTVEAYALNLMGHGLELLGRVRSRSFFSLASGQPKAADGEIPILIYNPHPYPLEGIWECEFMLADQNWKEEFTMPTVFQNDIAMATQCEKENSNLNLDWRKRVVFRACLEPSSMNRFDVRLHTLAAKPRFALYAQDDAWHFRTESLDVVINTRTGLLDRYRVHGVDYLETGAATLLVIEDNDDSWAQNVNSFRTVQGSFTLLSEKKGSQISGLVGQPIPSVRLIEDGPVRSVVEAVFGYGDSYACLRYKLPKSGTELELNLRVNWNEKSRMLKLAFPLCFRGQFKGQTAFGVQDLPMDGREAVAQKWLGLFSEVSALTVANDGTYGADYSERELRLSLLRSPGYCALPILERPLLPADRFSERIDQGERQFNFWINAGAASERTAAIEREALAHNETPFALSFFPSGEGRTNPPVIEIDDPVVVLSAFMPSFDGLGYILRLFEPSGIARTFTLRIAGWPKEAKIGLGAFEVKTIKINVSEKWFVETDLLEHHESQGTPHGIGPEGVEKKEKS